MNDIYVMLLFFLSLIIVAILLIPVLLSLINGIVKTGLFIIRRLKRKRGVRHHVVSESTIDRFFPRDINDNVFVRPSLLIVSVALLMSVWCLRLAVGCFSAAHPVGSDTAVLMTPFETLMNSFIHTLQTFSLDEDYREYIIQGRQMMNCVFGAESGWINVFVWYASALNALAPVAGGAIIFQIISEFFPKVRLWAVNLSFWRDKFYFSELNDKSLALADSILKTRRFCVDIIFTDAYTDVNREDSNERLAKARSMHAICVKDDLEHVHFGWFTASRIKICLMDESENSNLQCLTALLADRRERVKKSDIYIFSTDGAFSHMEDEVSFIVENDHSVAQARQNAEKKYPLPADAAGCPDAAESRTGKKETAKQERIKKKRISYVKKRTAAVIPVNSVRNMVENLFVDLPLFEPIIDKKAEKGNIKRLTVTILGSGVIGTEFFLTTYWCGQMLDCELNINVISNEKRKGDDGTGRGSFEGRIDYINPDILKSAIRSSDLLRYKDGEGPSDVYFHYDYEEINVLSCDFSTLIRKKNYLETDYFIVALGSDEENFNVANKLREFVGKSHLFDQIKHNTVISYVIYNSDLCRALNKNHKFRYRAGSLASDAGDADVYMHAFGAMDDVYSARNVFFEDMADDAYDIDDWYQEGKGEISVSFGHNNNKDIRFKDFYSYRANISRRVHRKYKEYSAGFHPVSVFTASDIQTQCHRIPGRRFVSFVVLDRADKICRGGETKMQLLHRLAWLEHRRWCAFMRTLGFRRPDAERGESYKKYFGEKLSGHEEDDHKYMPLKLHPCIVECGQEGIVAQFDKLGNVKDGTDMKERIIRDYLDELSWDRKDSFRPKPPKKFEDFKKWDYPYGGISEEERKVKRKLCTQYVASAKLRKNRRKKRELTRRYGGGSAAEKAV